MLELIQEAQRQFDRNQDFKKWAHTYYKKNMKMGGCGRDNPDMDGSMIAEAYEEWLASGKRKK